MNTIILLLVLLIFGVATYFLLKKRKVITTTTTTTKFLPTTTLPPLTGPYKLEWVFNSGGVSDKFLIKVNSYVRMSKQSYSEGVVLGLSNGDLVEVSLLLDCDSGLDAIELSYEMNGVVINDNKNCIEYEILESNLKFIVDNDVIVIAKTIR